MCDELWVVLRYSLNVPVVASIRGGHARGSRTARRRAETARGMPLLPGPMSKTNAPVPLREIVALCLDDWGVHSDRDESDSDDFCGWHVGSRVVEKVYTNAPAAAAVRQRARKVIDTPISTGAKSTNPTCEIQ